VQGRNRVPIAPAASCIADLGAALRNRSHFGKIDPDPAFGKVFFPEAFDERWEAQSSLTRLKTS